MVAVVHPDVEKREPGGKECHGLPAGHPERLEEIRVHVGAADIIVEKPDLHPFPGLLRQSLHQLFAGGVHLDNVIDKMDMLFGIFDILKQRFEFIHTVGENLHLILLGVQRLAGLQVQDDHVPVFLRGGIREQNGLILQILQLGVDHGADHHPLPGAKLIQLPSAQILPEQHIQHKSDHRQE
ncbi:hypothetical protein D3C75_907070 [compost metagenome]